MKTHFAALRRLPDLAAGPSPSPIRWERAGVRGPFPLTHLTVSSLCLASMLAVATAHAADSSAAPKEKVFETKPLGIQLSVKMVGPYMEAADLQIICLFKHKDSGDTYEGAAKDTDAHLGGLLSALRNRGEFVGELGETFLFTPPKGSIPAKRFMVIGLGDEKDLSLDTLRVVGRVAAREAVRLKAQHVAKLEFENSDDPRLLLFDLDSRN